MAIGTGLGVQRKFLVKGPANRKYRPFMTSPGPDCTYSQPEKRKVWAGKVTVLGNLQSARGRISSPDWKIVVLF
jgi:hypothetical protein